MPKSLIQVLTLVLVSILGLVSCAPEKSATEATSPTPQPAGPRSSQSPPKDDFFIAKPEAVDPGTRAARSLLDAKEPFSAQSTIRFPSLTGHDFKKAPVEFKVDTSCTYHQTQLASTQEFKNTPEVRLQDLLPAAVLFQPLNPTAPVRCTSEFAFRNHIGSTHSFSVFNYEIKDDPSRSESALRIDGRTLRSESAGLPVLDHGRFELTEIAGVPDSRGTVSLFCERFDTTVEGSLRSISFSGLAKAPATNKIRRYDAAPDRAKAEFPRQICRVVTVDQAGKRIYASPYFEIRFPQPVPEVHAAFSLDGDEDWLSHDGQNPLFTIQVRNPHPFPLRIAVRTGSELSAWLEPTAVADHGGIIAYVDPVHRSRIDLTINSPVTVESMEDLRALNLPPGETASFHGRIGSLNQCRARIGDRSLIGFGFRLDSLFPVYSFARGAGAKAEAWELAGEIQTLTQPDRPAAGHLPGWAPWTAERSRTSGPRRVVRERLARTEAAATDKRICNY